MAQGFDNTFRLVIASVTNTHFDGAAAAATFPGTAGVFTVLPHHEALITTLKKGTIVVREQGGSQREFPVESGVVECSGNRAVVLL